MNLRHVLLLGVAATALVGCGGSGAGIVGQQQPRVRLFNAMDGQATIFADFKDANLKDLGISTNASFGSTSNDTIIANTTATATLNGSTGALATTQPSLYRDGTYYSLYAFGAAFQGYRGLAVQDSQAVAPNGMIGIRAIHVGVNLAAADVYVLPTGTAITASNELFSDLGYGTVSSTANTVQAVDANGYLLEQVTDHAIYAVTVSNHGAAASLMTVPMTVNQGSYYTIVVFDPPVGSGLKASISVLVDHRTD